MTKTMMTMVRPYSVVSRVAALLVFVLISISHASAKPIDSIEEAINAAPIRDLRKLQAVSTVRGALSDLNKFYGQHCIGQKAVIKAKVESAGPSSPGGADFKVLASPANVNPKCMSKPIPVLNWFYFGPEIPAAGSVAVGSEIKISGTIRRCEIVRMEDGTLRINFDLVSSKVEK